MFKLGPFSIGFEVKKREFSKQDRSVSPKGANDQGSFLMALSLLGNPENFLCYEIPYVNEIIFTQDTMFIITGAHYEKIFLNDGELSHATVHVSKKGDVLKLQKLTKGFRVYLTATKIDKTRIVKTAKPYSKDFIEHQNTIRVTKGPEFDYLEEDFFNMAYKISTKSDLSGLRLERKLQAKKYDIITSAVTDGTIQLTKDGPIVLMRHRQTTGGYPRILNVIEADMDRLAQYHHGALVRFELVSIEVSIELLLEYEKSIQKILMN